MYLTYQLLICGCRGFKYRPVFRELWHCSNQLLTQTPQCSHSGGCNDNLCEKTNVLIYNMSYTD